MSFSAVNKDFKEEWQWTRYMIKDKLFAAIVKNGQGEDTMLTLKLSPDEGAFLREQYEAINPGYYMNKLHWNSINLDYTVPNELIRGLIEKSYHLVLSGFSKKIQKEILERE